MQPPHSRRLRAWLDDLALHGIKLGLENITTLLAAAGNPQNSYPTIHIGGTNGKGSVVAILDAMLRAAGYRTGRFTSPHLIRLNERFLIDGRPVADGQLDAQLDYFRERTRVLGHMPTFFELNTAVAFRLFEEACVDVAIVEVGMGGRFDSTNVIQPVATAITTIGLEHTAYLGDTLEKIAFEKAGIIKPETPVVIGDIAPEPRSVITSRAADVAAPVHLLGTDFGVAVEGHPWEQRIQFNAGGWRLSNASLALAGRYQAANAAVAIELARALVPHFPRLDKRTIVAGLANARWPCRMHQVLDHPRVIIDVAHNVAGVERLADSIDKAVVLLAIAEDKDANGMLRALDPIADRLILSRFTGSRGRAPEALAASTGRTDFDLCASLDEALALGMRYAESGLPLLITGSIFTAGEAYSLLQKNYGVPPLRF